MHRAATFLATLLLSCVASFASGGDAADTALCARIAAHIRSRPPAAKAGDPFDFAFSGLHPWIEAARSDDEFVANADNDWADYHATLTARFHPDAKLAEAFAQFEPEAPRLASLPGSPVHALIATGGTLHCQTFIFFLTGTPSRKLPDLARGENDGALCWNDWGALARANGRPVFLYRYDAITRFDYQIGIVPLEHEKWGEGCRVDAAYQTLYTLDTLSEPDGTDAEEFASDALALARAHKFSTGKYVAFSPIPAAQRDAWDSLMTQAQAALDLDWHERSYGPLVLGGKLYFATANRQGVGWRENPDVEVDLYALVQGKFGKVGSASITAAPGRLLSVRVLAGGVQP